MSEKKSEIPPQSQINNLCAKAKAGEITTMEDREALHLVIDHHDLGPLSNQFYDFIEGCIHQKWTLTKTIETLNGLLSSTQNAIEYTAHINLGDISQAVSEGIDAALETQPLNPGSPAFSGMNSGYGGGRTSCPALGL